jgi:hypothetical protein
MYMHGYDTNDPMRWSYYATAQIYGAFDKPRTAITNSNGKATDAQGTIALYMMDGIYYSITKNRVVNYGGNKTGLRQFGYTWLNDGTDYGYILTVTAENYSGIQRVIPSNQTFNETIVLNSNSTTSGEPDWVNYSCFSPEVMLVETYASNGGAIETQDYVPCDFGCESGVCNEPMPVFKYYGLLFLAYVAVIVFCFKMIDYIKDEVFKVFFLMLSLVILIACSLSVGVAGIGWVRDFSTANPLIAVGVVFAWIFILIAFYLLLKMLVNFIKNKDVKYEW